MLVFSVSVSVSSLCLLRVHFLWVPLGPCPPRAAASSSLNRSLPLPLPCSLPLSLSSSLFLSFPLLSSPLSFSLISSHLISSYAGVSFFTLSSIPLNTPSVARFFISFQGRFSIQLGSGFSASTCVVH